MSRGDSLLIIIRESSCMERELRVGDTFIYMRDGEPVVRHVGVLPQGMFIVMTKEFRVVNVYSSLEGIKQHYKMIAIYR